MGVTIFITCVMVLLLVLEIIYWTRYRGHPKEVYNPLIAWTRALIVFCSCFIISWATGTMNKVLAVPLVTPEQLKKPSMDCMDSRLLCSDCCGLLGHLGALDTCF